MGRLERVLAVVCTVGMVGGILVAFIPAAASASRVRRYSPRELLAGLVFDVGAVGQHAYGRTTGRSLTAPESRIMAALDARLGSAELRGVALALQSGNVPRVAKAIARVNGAARAAASPKTGDPYFAKIVREAQAALRARHSGGAPGTLAGATASAAGYYLTTYVAINLAAITEQVVVFEGAFFWTPTHTPAQTQAFANHLATTLYTRSPVSTAR